MGEPIFDDQFDLSSVEAQQSLAEFCNELKLQDFVKNQKISCWLFEFQTWYQLNDNPASVFINDKAIFDQKLYEWATTTEAGLDAKAKMTIGFIN